MRKLLVILGLLGLVGCSSQAHLVRQQWYEIRSDHFRVLTDSSTPEYVEVLVRDLERFRTATIHLLNYSLPDEEVLTVFALKNRASYKGIAGAEMSRKTLGLF